MEELNTVFQAASQEMYAAQQEAGGAEGGQPNPEGETSDNSGEDVGAEDVDFEEVKED